MVVGKSIPILLDFPEAGHPATFQMTEVQEGIKLPSLGRLQGLAVCLLAHVSSLHPTCKVL